MGFTRLETFSVKRKAVREIKGSMSSCDPTVATIEVKDSSDPIDNELQNVDSRTSDSNQNKIVTFDAVACDPNLLGLRTYLITIDFTDYGFTS